MGSYCTAYPQPVLRVCLSLAYLYYGNRPLQKKRKKTVKKLCLLPILIAFVQGRVLQFVMKYYILHVSITSSPSKEKLCDNFKDTSKLKLLTNFNFNLTLSSGEVVN